MGGSHHKWYQDEALMEGKKITTSILPLAIDLREIGRSKKQGARRKTLGLGWNFSLFSRESCKKKGRGKRTPPYIDNGNGSHNLKVQIGLKHRSTGFGWIRRRRKNRSSKFLLSKKYIFYKFRRY